MRPENSRSTLETVVGNSVKETEVLHSARQTPQSSHSEKREVLPAAQWLRAVAGFEAPYGHDGLPTVWG